MEKSIFLTIDDSQIQAREGQTILEAAQENGIDIPTLCYRPELTPFGACRLCVVEVEGSRTLVGSCHTPATSGLVIYTHSLKVIETRKIIVELLLASHPDSCLVCDKVNLCELRKIAADLGIGLPQFRLPRHYYPIEDANPYVIRDLSKCILCRRCVRACKQIAGPNIFGVAYRGFDSKIVVDFDQPLDKEACQNCDVCISFCPTGALSKKVDVRTGKRGKPLIIKG